MSDQGKRWMLLFYAICGALAGVMIGFILLVFLTSWMHDGAALEVLCGVCGALIGLKAGEKALLG